VRSTFGRAALLGGSLTVAALVVLFATSGLRARVLDVYFLALGAVVMLTLFRAIRLDAGREPSTFDRALAAMRSPLRENGELVAARDVELSSTNVLHFHVRVRPVLRQIAAYRLRVRYGVELDREPLRARELLPTALWDVVRPDLLPPADRLARGPSVAAQRALLDELERL
jgi:hypothetical protein